MAHVRLTYVAIGCCYLSCETPTSRKELRGSTPTLLKLARTQRFGEEGAGAREVDAELAVLSSAAEITSGAASQMAQPDTVPLSDLVFTATHSVHHGLLQLSERLGQNLTDLQRREYLLQYIAQARTLLGRLLALSRWSAARMPEVQRASDALAELDRRQIGMRKTVSYTHLRAHETV